MNDDEWMIDANKAHKACSCQGLLLFLPGFGIVYTPAYVQDVWFFIKTSHNMMQCWCLVHGYLILSDTGPTNNYQQHNTPDKMSRELSLPLEQSMHIEDDDSPSPETEFPSYHEGATAAPLSSHHQMWIESSEGPLEYESDPEIWSQSDDTSLTG